MTQNVQLVIIDPQVSFMDYDRSSLQVPGASADMTRLAAMIGRVGNRIDDIHVTLDSHHAVDVGHPAMWRGANGQPPPGLTAISSDDIRNGIWTPRMPHAKPAQLEGETILQYMIRYASTLEQQGNHMLMVWNPHTEIGHEGHNIQSDLMVALDRWADDQFANIDFVTKGVNPWTEHYGALEAEVPMPNDPSTQLNTGLLEVLETADIIGFAGEALTHCLMETVKQVARHVDERLVRKFHLLTDATSPIPAVPGGPDFPAMANAWIAEMTARGMVLTTTTEFLA